MEQLLPHKSWQYKPELNPYRTLHKKHKVLVQPIETSMSRKKDNWHKIPKFLFMEKNNEKNKELQCQAHSYLVSLPK